MSAVEVFNVVCAVVFLASSARFLWVVSESQLNCEEYLKQIADNVCERGDEPRQGPADACADEPDQAVFPPVV